MKHLFEQTRTTNVSNIPIGMTCAMTAEPLIQLFIKILDQIGQLSLLLLTNECLYICNSYFYDMSGNTNGGCIYVSTKSSTTKLLVETSTFYNSSVLSKGAVIFMQEGNSILSKLCGVECKTEQNPGAFSRIDVTNHETSINRVLDSTITRCSSVDNGYPLCNYYGKIIMKSVNISKNKCAVLCISLLGHRKREKFFHCFNLIHINNQQHS